MNTQTTRTVIEAQVSWTADHEQYWPGHGISFTHFDECSTGIGDTLREAFDDCLENLAQCDIHLTVQQEEELLADLVASADEYEHMDLSIVDVQCSAKGEHLTHTDDCPEECDDAECVNENPDCSVCAGEWHFYVSIDVKLSDSTELNSLEAL